MILTNKFEYLLDLKGSRAAMPENKSHNTQSHRPMSSLTFLVRASLNRVPVK